MLGQIGANETLPLIRVLERKLPSDGDYYSRRMRREAYRAMERIGLKNDWDPEISIRLIRSAPSRKSLGDTDLVVWLRDLHFTRDPEGYLYYLLSDLDNPDTDAIKVKELVLELATRYFRQATEQLPRLLEHPNAEVAAEVACFILDLKPGHPKALNILEHLAFDPSVLVPDDASYNFGRAKALGRLTSELSPPDPRWQPPRIRLHLQENKEDGRMVGHFLRSLKQLGSPATDDEQRQAYRKSLEREPGCGVDFACSELRRLRDRICDNEARGLAVTAREICDFKRFK